MALSRDKRARGNARQQMPRAERMQQPRQGRSGQPSQGRAQQQGAARARRTSRQGAGSSASRQASAASARQRRSVPDRQAEEAFEYTSTSVGELRRADREKRARKTVRRHLARVIAIVAVVVALVVAGAVLYQSPAFTITDVEVNGVEHLTSSEMSQLANVAPDATLLRVDADAIANRLKKSAWVEDVQINRVFPSTLQINVTERQIAAIVEIPVNASTTVKSWAIANDHMWLMPIPDADSEAAKTTSSKIYEDAESALHIVDVPIGTKAEIGQTCTDSNVNNALDILSGMTTELSQRVVEVSAAGTAETTLVLDNGVEIAFGKAEDIRDKERVVLQILEENPDNVSYINVRMVETPTWRAI